MRKLLVGICALLFFVSVTAARPIASAPAFRITLEHSEKGWTAQCDSGCSWSTLSASCANDCPLVIDANGVSRDLDEKRSAASFGFILRRNAKGWQANALVGTMWEEVSWGCGEAAVCRARLTPEGVTPLEPR